MLCVRQELVDLQTVNVWNVMYVCCAGQHSAVVIVRQQLRLIIPLLLACDAVTKTIVALSEGRPPTERLFYPHRTEQSSTGTSNRKSQREKVILAPRLTSTKRSRTRSNGAIASHGHRTTGLSPLCAQLRFSSLFCSAGAPAVIRIIRNTQASVVITVRVRHDMICQHS